jgi:predicted dehydrogenase
MRALIIGFGSIGRQHFKELQSRGCAIDIVSIHLGSMTGVKVYKSIDNVVNFSMYDIVVVANHTSQHASTYKSIRSMYNGLMLVEKPTRFENKVVSHDANCFVGYDLRFSPLFSYLFKNIYLLGNIYQVHSYCGQDLNQWRDRPIKETSSVLDKFGGVINDLSHELDYLFWVFEQVDLVSSIYNQKSYLGIDQVEYTTLLLESNDVQISCQLNYLDRIPTRFLRINGTEGYIVLDFIENCVNLNGIVEFFEKVSLMSVMYDDLFSSRSIIATLDESLKVDKLISELDQ